MYQCIRICIFLRIMVAGKKSSLVSDINSSDVESSGWHTSNQQVINCHTQYQVSVIFGILYLFFLAAYGHELMIRLRTMRPSIAPSANNWTCSLQPADIPPPQSATLGLCPVAHKLLLMMELMDFFVYFADCNKSSESENYLKTVPVK